MGNKFNKKTAGGNQGSGLLIYGRHAVEAAIGNPARVINRIMTTAENSEVLKKLLLQSGRDTALLKVVERKEIDKQLPAEAVHQGIAAQVKPLENQLLEDICILAEGKDRCRVLILDQVTDPQNVGAIIRSCAAFGADALIMQDKNAPAESGAMVKASAGTIEFLPVCRVTNLSRAIEHLKKAGFWVAGRDGYAETTIDKMKKNGRIAIVMGSEGKGIRRLGEESCDETVKLPIDARVESLNVSTAAAIALYEMSRE